MATDMAQQAEPETLKLSSGTAALWEYAVKAPLVSVTAVLEGAEWSFSASVVARWLGECGAEVISSSLQYNVLKVTGTDMNLRHSNRKDQAEAKMQRCQLSTLLMGYLSNFQPGPYFPLFMCLSA